MNIAKFPVPSYLRAILDRCILYRKHVHVVPAALAALGLGAIVGHELMNRFARDGCGQISWDLT